jgi:DNA modification methylase
MAGERVGRRVYGIELDPLYCDVAVRRWQTFTGRDAILQPNGKTFDEIQSERASLGTRGPQ